MIKNSIKHPEIQISERNRINNIIFSKYKSWSIDKAYKFKKFHRYKCRNISIEDLKLYSLEGLMKAVKKYNGNSFFHYYAEKYIMGELYKGLTDLQPITIIPKSIRRSKTNTLKTENNYIYKKLLNTQFIGFDNYWMFEKRQPIKTEINSLQTRYDIWNSIKLKDAFSKRVFEYKYDIDFNKIRSNKQISILMACSEETIRKNMEKTKEKIKNTYLKKIEEKYSIVE